MRFDPLPSTEKNAKTSMASVQDGKIGTQVAGPARAAIDSARKMMDSGDADGAVSALRNFTSLEDAPAPELADAAKIMAEAGMPLEAVTRYLEAGRGYLAGGDAGRARQCFAGAYEIDGKNLDALFELGRVDVAEGKRHDALDKFVEILRKSNLKHLPALYEAGCLYEQDGQHNQAILAFKRVVDRDKTHASALEHLASLHTVRHQLPDAVGYYAKAAEAAHAQLRSDDAKRLAEAALEIDATNAVARRILTEASKPQADSKSVAPPPPAAAAAAASPAADAKPAPAPSDAVPPPLTMPAPSLSINLPSEVALLEQQSRAMAQLAQVQSAVAQTYKQRIALDEEIRKAQAALEELQRKHQSVEDDLSGRRDDLAKVVAQREAEEATLAALGDAIAKSKGDLDALAGLGQIIADAQARCASAGELASKTTASLTDIAAKSDGIRTAVSSIEANAKDVAAKVAAAKQSAGALEGQLAETAGATKGVREAADAATAQTEEAKRAVEGLAAQRQAVQDAAAALSSMSAAIQQKRDEATAAIARLQALQAQRKSQFDEIVFALPTEIGGAARAAAAPKAPPAAAATPAPAPAPAPTAAAAPAMTAAAAPAPAAASGQAPQAGTAIDGLIAAGKFSDAVARAQTDANAQPKPSDFLVEVADKIRRAGKLEDAVKLYAAARDRDQKNGRARYELGSACVDLGRVDEALAALQSVEADPDYAVLGQVAIGRALRKKGDLDGAESRFSKALEVEGRPDSDYHQALYQLAELHESKGDPDSLGLALWAFEELQTGNPGFADVKARVDRLKEKIANGGAPADRKRNGSVKQ